MNKHVFGYGALVLGLVVLAWWATLDHFQHALEIAKVQAQIEGRKAQQKDDDAKLQDLKDAKAESDARYVESQKTLQKMTPQQIVQKAPQFISGIPASSRPITIFGAGVAPPMTGDAIVPQDQIKPIAETILKGKNCTENDLPSCLKGSDLWKDKYNLRDQDAKDWEKLAKGGTFWHRAKRCSILGGVGGGVAYAPQSANRGRNGIIGFGATAGVCMFIR